MGFISEKAYAEGYENGYKAGQKDIMDKACEWLKNNMYVEHIFEHSDDEESVQYVCASACDSVEEFVNKFRKAMEE